MTFTDEDGDENKFVVRDGAVVYSLGGEEWPPTKRLVWTTGPTVKFDSRGSRGECVVDGPGWITMPNIGEGFALPRDGLAVLLGGLRCLARKAGVRCNIGDAVRVLPEVVQNANGAEAAGE